MSSTSKATDAEIYGRDDGDWRARGNKLSVLDKLNPPRFKYFDRFVREWSGRKVLDVGCGAGFTAEFLAKRGAQVTGIDPCKSAIGAARMHASTLGLAIEYQTGNSERLPYDNGTFDTVVCVDVLEHVASVEESLQEAWRVLAPGGYFLFDTINKTLRAKLVMVWLLENVLGLIPRGAHDWRMFITPKRLQELLRTAGFENVSISGFPFKSVLYIGVAQKAL